MPFGDAVFALDFGTVALEVCEDVWSPDGPMRRRCYAGAEIVCNLSASPFRAGVLSARRGMSATRASLDAAYATLSYGRERLSILGRPGGKDVALELHSMSKSYKTKSSVCCAG